MSPRQMRYQAALHPDWSRPLEKQGFRGKRQFHGEKNERRNTRASWRVGDTKSHGQSHRCSWFGQEMMMTTITLRDFVEGLILEIDDKLDRTDESFMAGCVMVSAYAVPAVEPLITAELGYDAEFVAVVANRLRNAKIWIGDQLSPLARSRWEQEEGGAALICDMNVARGHFQITHYEGDEPMYSLTPAGTASVKRMLRA